MKKVLVFIESLDGGGAEAILRNTVSVIDKSKFDITVVTETDNERYTDEVRPYVHHRSFTKRNGSVLNEIVNKAIIKYSLLASEKAVRNNLIKGDYDVEIAFCEGYATKVVGNSGRKNCRKIAWVHTDVINHPWSEEIHIGADIITLCSMLRIPVTLHNVPDEKIFRPACWNAFGTKDLEAADVKACEVYGPLYK